MGVSAAVHPTDPILQAYGFGKLDDVSAESVDKHLESCAACRHRVAELSSDGFLGRLQNAKVGSDKSAAGGSPSGVSSTDSVRGSDVPPEAVDTLPPELVDHPDYEIVRELGRGGMGVVYLVRNKLMGRLEVLKVVGGHLVERPGVRDRFLREVQSAAKLQHKNIVAAYSAMRLGESIVLAMEYVDGEDLAKMVKSRGPLPVVHACYFIHQAALGLQHAHERGMVHRDIKPANLIFAALGKKGIVKVLDFGLAKVSSEGQTDNALTREGQMLGTPDYIAPEQIRDAQSADIRADIYSLGCTLYYLLTGGPPFRGEHLWDLYQAHFSMEAGPLNLVRPEVPIELAAAVAKMMAKEPRRRFQTPGEVAQALTPFFKKGNAALKVFQDGSVYSGRSLPRSDSDQQPSHVASAVSAGKLASTLAERNRGDTVATRSSAPTLVPGPLSDGTPTQRVRKATPVAIDRPPPPARPRVWSNQRVVTGIACALITIALAFWAGGVLRVRTADGILVVQVNVPNPDLYVDGEKVTVAWQNGGVKAEVGVKPGTRKVELKKDGFRAYGEEVTLEDHGRTVLAARLEPKTTPPPVPPPDDAPKRETGKKRDSAGESHEPVPPPPGPPDVVHVGPEALDCTGPNGVSADVVRQAQEAWAKYLGRDVEANVPIASGVTMTFVLVPPGKFWMGSPPNEMGKGGRYPNETLHEVTLTEPFDIGQYEVTQAQYAALTGRHPSFYRGSRRPVEQVTWRDADAFGRDLTKKLSDRYVYRLATEAEWEYSCRGGRPSSLPFGIGDGRSLTSRDANFNNLVRQTSKVGSYAANALGLCDMHGNVWEWCADWNEPYPNEAVTNPLRVVGGPFRVARGGCHNEPAAECRSALRQGSPEERRDCWMGFRLARSVPSAGK